MTNVEPWVRNLTESVIGGAPVQIGKHYMHPEDGHIVITSGQYWGTYGLSNFWYWNVLDEAGRAVRGNHGYAGRWPPYTPFQDGICRACGHAEGDHEPLDDTRWTCDEDGCDQDLRGWCK